MLPFDWEKLASELVFQKEFTSTTYLGGGLCIGGAKNIIPSLIIINN